VTHGPSKGFVHRSSLCWVRLQPDDDIVTAEPVPPGSDASDAESAAASRGERFRRTCYAMGMPGSREIARGSLGDLTGD
jgi:hypothetical protein